MYRISIEASSLVAYKLSVFNKAGFYFKIIWPLSLSHYSGVGKLFGGWELAPNMRRIRKRGK